MSDIEVQDTETTEAPAAEESRTYSEEEMATVAAEVERLRAELKDKNKENSKWRHKVKDLRAVIEDKPEQSNVPVRDDGAVSREEFEKLQRDLRRRDYQDLLTRAAEKTDTNPRLVRSLLMENGVPDIDFSNPQSAYAEIESQVLALAEELPEIKRQVDPVQHQKPWGAEPADRQAPPADIQAYLERVAQERPEDIMDEWDKWGGDSTVPGIVL